MFNITQIRLAAPRRRVGRQIRIGKPQGRRQADVAAADDSDG
jgi:hypothetical protein